MKLFGIVLSIAGLKELTDTACQFLGTDENGKWLIKGMDGVTYDVEKGQIQFITSDELTEEECEFFGL